MLTKILDVLMAIGKYIIENVGAIATLAGVAIAFYGLKSWKREYRFKRDSELLEEAMILFYQAEHAIADFRNGYILVAELKDFEFSPKLEEIYFENNYKYTYTFKKRFDEKQDIFNRLEAIELRFRARFGEESITAFSAMKKKVCELSDAFNMYSQIRKDKDRIAEIEKIIFKDYNKLLEEGDVFGDAVNKIVKDFEIFCRRRLEGI
jgi:hypothetical protein